MNHEDADGFRCRDCWACFPEFDAVEHEVKVLLDSMYGRRPTLETQIERLCPHCDSTNIEGAYLCERCHAAPMIPGSDYCAPCDKVVELEEHQAFMRSCREQRHRELIGTLIGIARAGAAVDDPDARFEQMRRDGVL